MVKFLCVRASEQQFLSPKLVYMPLLLRPPSGVWSIFWCNVSEKPQPQYNSAVPAQQQQQDRTQLPKTTGMELMGGDDDMRAFEATLSFVEEYASDTFTSTDFPGLSVTSDASHSFSLRLADDVPTELLQPVDVVPSSSSTSPIATIDTSSMMSASGTQQFSIGLPNRVPTTTTTARAPSKPRKSTRKRRPQTNPNRARNELRFELAFLREKVTQLQQELQSLQPDNLICQGEEDTPTTIATLSSGSRPRPRSRPSSQVLCAWKGVAGRQQRRREDAERENARLRLNVEHQRKVAIDLTKLLRKRVRCRSLSLRTPCICFYVFLCCLLDG